MSHSFKFNPFNKQQANKDNGEQSDGQRVEPITIDVTPLNVTPIQTQEATPMKNVHDINTGADDLSKKIEDVAQAAAGAAVDTMFSGDAAKAGKWQSRKRLALKIAKGAGYVVAAGAVVGAGYLAVRALRAGGVEVAEVGEAAADAVSEVAGEVAEAAGEMAASFFGRR